MSVSLFSQILSSTALDLPPAPDSWSQVIRAGFVEDEERTLFNRKRKSTIDEEDVTIQAPQIRKQETDTVTVSVNHESDASEDEDDDSAEDDEDDEDDDGINNDNDISKYLGQNDRDMGDLPGFYDDMSYDADLSVNELNGSLQNFQSPVNNDLLYPDINHSQQTDWPQPNSYNSSQENRMMSWPHRFGGNESDVAVESILSQDEDDSLMSAPNLDMNGGSNQLDDVSQGDEEDEEDSDEEDDDDDDEEEEEMLQGQGHFLPDGSNMLQESSLPPCDTQMQSAIDSILDMPSHQQPMVPYYNAMPQSHGSFGNRGYGTMPHMHNMSMHRGMHPSFGGPSQSSSNDPMLDEAVKSILS